MRTFAYTVSLIFVFMIPWEGAITFGEWGTLPRVVGILAAAAWLASVVVTWRLCKPHPFHLAMAVFVLWNTASLFWTLAFPQTLQYAKTYFQLALLSWVIWDLYTTPKALTAALQAYVLGGCVTIGSTIYNYRTGTELSAGRYTGAGLNANDVVFILALGLPVALYLATSQEDGRRRPIRRILNCAYVPASLFAMSLTGGRTFIFIAIPSVLYAFIIAKQLKPIFRLLIASLFVMALPLILSQIPESTMERLSTAGNSVADMDLGGRVRLWHLAFQIFENHPILGVGAGAIHPPAQIGHVVHNTFLSVATELGVIGFLMFTTIVAIVFRETLKQTRPISRLWLVIFATWLIGAFTLNEEITKQTWLFMNLILISARLFAERSQPCYSGVADRPPGVNLRARSVDYSERTPWRI